MLISVLNSCWFDNCSRCRMWFWCSCYRSRLNFLSASWYLPLCYFKEPASQMSVNLVNSLASQGAHKHHLPSFPSPLQLHVKRSLLCNEPRIWKDCHFKASLESCRPCSLLTCQAGIKRSPIIISLFSNEPIVYLHLGWQPSRAHSDV